LVVLAALALVELSSTESHAEPKKSAAPVAAQSADLDLLVEVARARTLPAGLDESSPELAKIVALVAAGKLKTALPIIAKYGKANAEHLNETTAAQVASWIVRRALLLPDKSLYTAVDRLRFAKDGKLALAKYEAGLAGKASTDLAPAFAVTPYAEGGDAVATLTTTKKVSEIRKDLKKASKDLAAATTDAKVGLQDAVTVEKGAWGGCLKSCADSKGEVQKSLARF
jgi:hypothetical protein